MFLQNWWVLNYWQHDPILLISWVFWIVFSISLHELGHGIVAIKCGDDTPRLSGHMTLNPFVHIPQQAWIMFAVTGMTWGLMPVNTSRLRRSVDDAWVSAAGPAVNLILAVICLVFAACWFAIGQKVAGATLVTNLGQFLRVGAVINLVCVPFNLIPVPPLDGSRILAVFSRAYREKINEPGVRTAGLVLLVLMMLFIGRILYPFAFTMTDTITYEFGRLLRDISR